MSKTSKKSKSFAATAAAIGLAFSVASYADLVPEQDNTVGFVEENADTTMLLVEDTMTEEVGGVHDVQDLTAHPLAGTEVEVEILVEDGMTMEDAMEYFDFNVKDAWVGDKTPIWCNDMM